MGLRRDRMTVDEAAAYDFGQRMAISGPAGVPGPAPGVVAAGSVLAVLREAGE